MVRENILLYKENHILEITVITNDAKMGLEKKFMTLELYMKENFKMVLDMGKAS